MFGKITLIGRLGGDPEMRYTPQGKPVTNMSLAVDQGYGERKATLWVKVTAWGNNDGTGGKAEACANYLKKGSLVFVEGEPTVRAYIHTDGEPRASLEVNAREIKFLDPKPQDGNGQQTQARPAQAAKPAASLAATAATASPAYVQISPDKKFGWDGKAWVPIPAPVPPPPAAAPIPPPPPGADDTARDVDPDDIPF
jgi:single-strand DNA-binding protein